MSGFSFAIVFSSQPKWESLRELPPQIGMRGYRHNDASIWLLEFWSDSPPPSDPFTEGYELAIFSTFDADRVAEQLGQLEQHIEGMYGGHWLRFALQVSRLTNQNVFCFAADDEFYDFGASVSPNSVERLTLRVSMLNVRAQQGRLIITPQIDVDDDLEESDAEELIGESRKLPFVSVRDSVEIAGGFLFFGNAIAEWPTNAGDPQELLGLGTIDAFLDVDKRLELEFERLAELPKKAKSGDECHLGFMLELKNPFVQSLLGVLNMPCRTHSLSDITDESLPIVDTLVLINPAFDDDQCNVFLGHVEAGGTAIVLVSMEQSLHLNTQNLLECLGLRIAGTKPTRQLTIRYTNNYPVTSKRGSNAKLRLAGNKKPYATFSCERRNNLTHLPLITIKGFISQSNVAIKVNYGRGTVVVMDSAGFLADRAELVEHMLKVAEK